MRKFTLALIMLVLSVAGAEAKSHHRHHGSRFHSHTASIVAHPTGCPWHAFCGCGASARIFGRPVRNLYLAANWFRFPRAHAAPGMAAVRSHHVFIIEQVYHDGTVLAYDANSGGHQTRIHRVSLRGYTVVDPHATRRRYANAG